MSESYPLAKAISAHGESITELTIRDVTPSDARMIGDLPYYVMPDESVRVNVGVSMKYLVRIAGVPMSSLDQLHMIDVNALCWKVAGFFLQQEQGTSPTSSDSPTTALTSGA